MLIVVAVVVAAVVVVAVVVVVVVAAAVVVVACMCVHNRYGAIKTTFVQPSAFRERAMQQLVVGQEEDRYKSYYCGKMSLRSCHVVDVAAASFCPSLLQSSGQKD